MPKFNGETDDCGDSDGNGDWMTVVTVVTVVSGDSGDSGAMVIVVTVVTVNASSVFRLTVSTLL